MDGVKRQRMTAAGPEQEQQSRVRRIEVHPADSSDDPEGRAVMREAREMGLGEGLGAVRTARIYLIEAELDDAAAERIAAQLLTDPLSQRWEVGSAPAEEGAAVVEVHYLPGVMDPVAESTRSSIVEMLGLTPPRPSPAPHADRMQPESDGALTVRTGFRYELSGVDAERARLIARRLLANPVIQSISLEPYHPASFVHTQPYEPEVIHASLLKLDDAGLNKLSREGHLFLSLEEMRAIQYYFRELGREPTDIELETLAQTWSEHCVHKTLKSTIRYRASGTGVPARDGPDFANRPGHTPDEGGGLVIENLLGSTIAAATHQLREEGVDWCVSVFVDNAGIIEFDDEYALSFKVETHNHPSAIEPYGGAATGIGGCIRDTMGTGLGAKPIASTDVFCVADPRWAMEDLPAGVLHPRRILTQVVAGVRDYGNRMGIPTVNGAVAFDERYLGNPLVFCGSVGLIPRDKCFGEAREGDHIIVLGGRTGRDGIHGATFSSAQLSDTHADEFSHAVQIGNAVTEKKVLDVILLARDHEQGPLFRAITDCGAGGFSSAIGEMGEKVGAQVRLNAAPLKYAGLSYTEIWISEAQERMVLAVPPEKVQPLMDLAAEEDVEASDLGHFGTHDAQLILHYGELEVGRLDMHFLHHGLPMPTREARWSVPPPYPAPLSSSKEKRETGESIPELLLALLAHPDIASKHWIIRQYDHEVQGGSVVKPLVGGEEDGPSDAAVIRPRLDSTRGAAIANGMAPALGDVDPYWMALAAIDEAVRNAICVGARPDRIALLDNFCWPDCEVPEHLGALVRAAEGCYDGALAYRTPFISGKDSLNNQFTTESGNTIAIPPTLLISALGVVDDVRRCVTMDAKSPGNLLVQVGLSTPALGGSHLAMIAAGAKGGEEIPKVDLQRAPRQLACVAELIAQGWVRAAHDCSEGGVLVAAAEMSIAGRMGLEIDLAGVPRTDALPLLTACFAETPSRILLEVSPEQFDPLARKLYEEGVPFGTVGRFTDTSRFTVRSEHHGRVCDLGVEELREAWRRTLDW